MSPPKTKGYGRTLLDLNQIESGVIHPKIKRYPVNDLLGRLKDGFSYGAMAQGISLQVMPCGLSIESDPQLLEQMVRNILSNAIKYTHGGRVLVGCRRRGATLSIQVWDTGQGIPEDQLQAIFEEYRQLDNPNRDRNAGLGLGLSIVQRLGQLLGHHIDVRSREGVGSVFSIEVDLGLEGSERPGEPTATPEPPDAADLPPLNASILVVEDDPALRALLEDLLTDQGYQARSAVDGRTALDLVTQGAFRPDLLLADYNLPGDMDGLKIAIDVRRKMSRQIPVIILTGDNSSASRRDLQSQNCIRFTKPIKPENLLQAVRDQLLASPTADNATAAVPLPPEPPI
ncbi:MAG: ATP-binding protein [Thalassobaculaceae bacterium]|nr:ATP-binding protein [Thalassobaculaceae bacterium]